MDTKVHDALVKLFTEHRIALNVDAFMQDLAKAGLAISEREPTAVELGAAVRSSGQAGS